MKVVDIFIQILRMGSMASVVILAVLLARVLMKRFPKRYVYLLWIIVGIRLICPVAVSSPVSIFNLDILTNQGGIAERLQETETEQAGDSGNDGSVMTDGTGQKNGLGAHETHTQETNTQETHTEETTSAGTEKSANRYSEDFGERTRAASAPESETALGQSESGSSFTQTQKVLQAAGVLWLVGIALLLFWNVLQSIRMKRRLRKAVLYRDNIFECDNIASPFVMGIFRPRIYIPFRLEEKEREYILVHERYHIKRRDYITKLVAYLIAIVYWFHPLVWIAYLCMVRDMEMSCDEYVLAVSGKEIRQEYSRSLLAFATNQRRFSMGLLAFGETDTRRRVKYIMSFRKKGKWFGFFALLIIAVVGVVCLTNGRSAEKGTDAAEDTRTVIGFQKINDYEIKLLMNSGKQIEDKLSPNYKLYEGNFVLETYKEGEKCDVLEIEAEDSVAYFPSEVSLHLKDYDRDGKEDDFALGQSLGSSAMTYRFYTVEENGSIMPFTVSDEPSGYITAGKEGYSPDFDIKDDYICYSFYDRETGKSEKREVNLMKTIDLQKSPEAEISAVKKLQAAIQTVMPEKVAKETTKGKWKKGDRQSGIDDYSIANTEDFDSTTLRLDFSFKENVLIDYVSKEYGFVDEMKADRITKEQAPALVKKFAKAFMNRKLGKDDIWVVTGLPKRYDDKKHLMLADTQGGCYIVQLNRNMVVSYTQEEMLHTDGTVKNDGADDSKESDWLKDYDAVQVGYCYRRGQEPIILYVTPEGDAGERLRQMASKLDVGYGCPPEVAKQWAQSGKLHYELKYKGNIWNVYLGGCVQLFDGKDSKKETIMYLPELGRAILSYGKQFNLRPIG